MKGSETLSELTVPIKVKGKVIGVLDAQSERLDAFDESDKVVLQSLADQAAVAIENARLYRQAQQLAVVEERNRLARELHDSVTQALYGITLHAEAAFRQLQADQLEMVNEQLVELRGTAQEALREMRLLIFELRPSVVELQGLVPALQARLEAVEERAGMGVEFNVDGDLDLSDEIQDGLYRIAQEALNNALKHAKANHITLNISGSLSAVVLEVIDDGQGFDPDTAVEGGGLGLDGIIERAELMRGDLKLESKPGSGTRVRIEVPYE
jgi:signal transduction histidine kinase